MKAFFTKVTLPYSVYLMYFLGIGFLGGAIVHFPVNPNLYGAIGAVGAIIFTIASTLNEWITNRRHVLHEGVFKIILYSLVLSIGLGMISGGIQHFVDFPIYASYLVPIGFIISLTGYVMSKELKLDRNQKMLLIGKMVLIAIPLFLILNTWAKTMDTSAGHRHGSHVERSHDDRDLIEHNREEHHKTITSDEEFIDQMIPHHEEAVSTSNYLLSQTKNAQLTRFATDVIKVQSEEIAQMKEWYRTWFDKTYTANGEYTPMMNGLTTLRNEQLEKEYIKGMIVHHRGAIEMAEQILPITKRSEIKNMANDIITVQTREITLLQTMLENYDHEESEHMFR